MMKTKSLFYFFLFLIICSLGVVAAPPVDIIQINSLPDELTVVYPKDFYFPQNSVFDLHFHVVDNVSKALTVSEYDCFIHIYDDLNEHLLVANLTPSSNNYDLEVEINTTITSKLGVKPYNVFCNSSTDLYGFISGEIFITRNGEQYDPELLAANNSFLLFGVLGLALIFLIISYLFKGEEKQVSHLRGIFFYLGMTHLLISGLILATATNCEEGLCGDINRFGAFGEVYFYIIGAVLLYVLYTYSMARVTSVTENK